MYAELHCRSNFSFLQGGSHPETLIERAAALGLSALALTDRNGLYGAVRFHEAAKEHGLKAIYGSEITLADGEEVVLLCRDLEGYRNLSSLLTRARMDSPRGAPCVTQDMLWAHAPGLLLLAGTESPVQKFLFRGHPAKAALWFKSAQAAFGKAHVFLEGVHHRRSGDDERFSRLRGFAAVHHFPGLVTNAVRYATVADRFVYDVLTCVRERTSLAEAGFLLEPNAERRLKASEEMRSLFAIAKAARDADAVDWLEKTVEVARLCHFSLDELRYALPSWGDEGEPMRVLEERTWQGAGRRYGDPLSAAVKRQLLYELDVIRRLGFAGYFLIVWDVVRFCEERGILCQGRGSAANSAVCYTLGITAIDPVGMGLLFERFLSEGRKEPPDIDLDIAHNYREEVIQYVYEKYGRERAGMVCEVITYRGRSAVRDVGKALGFSLAQVDRIAKSLAATHPFEKTEYDGGSAGAGAAPVNDEWGVDPESRSVKLLVELSDRIRGFPRHLSIHVGGMVISAEPLHHLVPVEPAAMGGRTVIQWDKDDAAALGFVKIDLLGLGMLTLLQDGLELLEQQTGRKMRMYELDFADPAVFDLLCQADTVGVFQVESRAQMNCLPRLKPRRFYDLVVQVALIRPGPIQGEMVHPYLRRREGAEPVTYPHPDLIPILERTLGVPLFQEQGMRVAVTAAGFSAAEADTLRRAMGSKRSRAKMEKMLHRLIRGMEANGYDAEIAGRIVKQLTAFADYGFPESHAAGFAILVYASAWLKVHHAAIFYTALLNAQPMGFYSPSTIVNDAKRRGVPVMPIDAEKSGFDAKVEGAAVRLGFRSMRGMGEAYRETVTDALSARPFDTAQKALQALSSLPVHLQKTLVAGGAFDAYGESRRGLRWRLEKNFHGEAGPLSVGKTEAQVEFGELSQVEEMQSDYALTGLSVRHQPISFYRTFLQRRGCTTSEGLRTAEPGRVVRIGGLVICRQRPATAKGMLFLTLEDETGLANVVVFPRMLEKAKRLWVRTGLLLVWGKLERERDVTNVIAYGAEALPELGQSEQLSFASRDFR